MTAMYDGIDTRVPVRCLGCAPGVLDLPHQCAGSRELRPYGGRCQCPGPTCGGRTSSPTPADCSMATIRAANS